MRVLLISLFSNMPHHVATELEILQRHLDDGDAIEILACHGDLPACMHKVDAEPHQQRRRCRECITARSAALRLLDEAPPIHVLEDYYPSSDRERETNLPRRFASTDAIRDYHIDGFDAGYAALSSTVFLVRDAYLESTSSQDLLARMLVAAYRSFCSVREFLKQHPDFDRAYVFNGRFATCRGAFRACQHAGLEVFLHERGSDNSKFMLYENSLPHDLANMERRIRERWEHATPNERAVGQTFYEQRRARVEAAWHSHTKKQVEGRLPTSWDATKRNLVIFTSSDDEYVAIGQEWITPGFTSQTDAIRNLCGALREDDNVKITIRMHPHLRTVDNQDTRTLRGLADEHIDVVPPESDVCSYALLDRSEKVITFGSTIGVEATYWQKPSILAGMSFYRCLDATYIAHSDEELLNLARSELAPKARDAALMYGLHMSTFGEPFRYYEAKDFETGSFRGTQLRTAIPYSVFGMLLPMITRAFGKRPRQRNLVERVAYATCYVPFRVVYDLARPLRLYLRKQAANGS